ncbi:sugar ABC transporter permease [Jatrophihabitans sp.]|uniref:carbohydrate ABC transporter permease n=1 Tax=Jatrophihabitans sp. TaxID=1932789 RepID=UPI0030C69FED|nr:binding-protein-dependent transport system inner rane component [Jatrophihabitans sp.]
MYDSHHLILAGLAGDSASKLWGVIEAVGGFIAILAIIFLVAGKVTGRLERPLTIVICLVPVVLLLIIGLVIPAIRTFYLSLHGADAYGPTVHSVGFQNYRWAFSDPSTRSTLIRTVLWLVIVPAVATGAGLLVALLVDNMKRASLAKAFIFLPTAVSFVGASIIWKYIYNYTDPHRPQIGLLSEIVIKLGWKNPPDWMLSSPVNTFLLMVIMVWIQTGFAMVVLSAALKSIPDEIIEAARMDGATGYRLFRSVQVPMIRNTLVVVITTIMIATLKVFDIVYTVTGGNFNTDVLSNEMYTQIFTQFNYGRGSALAVILFLAVLPLVGYNVLQMRKERASR